MTTVYISAVRNSARDSGGGPPHPARFIPLGKFRGWPLYNSAAAAAVDLHTSLTYMQRVHVCAPRLS